MIVIGPLAHDHLPTVANVVLEVLDRFDAGGVVLPRSVSDLIGPQAMLSTCRVLHCLEDRHSVAIARGFSTVSGRVSAALVGSGAGPQCAADLALASADQVPLVAIILDAALEVPTSILSLEACLHDEVPELLVHALAMALFGSRGPVCLRLSPDLMQQRLSVRPDWRDLGRRLNFGAQDSFGPLAGEAMEALVEAEHSVILLGQVEQTPQARLDRQRLTDRLGATIIPAAGLQAMAPEHVRALNRADLILSLQCQRIPQVLALRTGSEDALVIHVAPLPPSPGFAEGKQRVAPIDIYVKATPAAAVSRFLHGMAAPDDPGDAVVNDGAIVPISILGPGMPEPAPSQDYILLRGGGAQNFVAAAVGAAGGLPPSFRPVIRIDATALAAEISALWTTSRHRLPLDIQIEDGVPNAFFPDLGALVRSYGIEYRQMAQAGDPAGPAVIAGAVQAGIARIGNEAVRTGPREEI